MNDHIYIPMSLYSQRVQVSELRVGNSLRGLAVASGVVSGQQHLVYRQYRKYLAEMVVSNYN